MSDLTRVPGPSSPLEGARAKVVALIVVGILVAIIKPWGTSGPAPAAQASGASPSASAAAVPSLQRIANYNPGVFGIHEPAPDWELWPAGYFTSFGFATRIDSLVAGSDEPIVAPSGSPSPSTPDSSGPPDPRASPALAGDPEAAQPVWPATITVSSGSHLSLLGINTPLGHTVSGITLSRRDPNGSVSSVPVVRLLSPWPAHFTIVAMDAGNGRDPKESWPPGRYVLEMRIEPDAISREIEIIIVETGANGASPAPASPPGNVHP